MTPVFLFLVFAMLSQTTLGLYLTKEASLERRARHDPAKIFKDLKEHIFHGEKENIRSGRHMLRAWCSANKSSHGICNIESKLCIFDGSKTVWDDRPGGYTAAHVEKLCMTAISHNVEGKARLHSGQYAIQTHFKRPICVRHDIHKKQNSCYPAGINFRRHPQSGFGSYEIGKLCPLGTGNDVDNYSSGIGHHSRGQSVNCRDIH
ncbi:hypothetical protein CPB84DRAFT_1775456 [Gymnopilus junonius]|uniref:Uncharacterized protein n=1 Tax=Gymnopilus junonius TaxID=109634 RepID=A0A9P5NS94_GYMJU|nr:hypothetical protein CPB84DRAFT_1775456 [Gymnopilus junonius]